MRQVRVLLLLALLGALPACASTGGLSKKQTVTLEILKPSHDVLANFQDLEISVYAQKVFPQLTPDLHRQIEGMLGTAFRDHAKASRALIIWRAGDPAPVSVAEYQKDIDDILGLVKDDIPQAANLIKMIQQGVDEAAKVAAAFKVGL